MGPAVRQLPLVCPGHNRGIVELQYSPPTPEGTFLISACIDGTPMLRDGVTGDWIGSFQGHKGAVWGACISNDAALAATAGADFTARLWNAVTGACSAVLPQKHICKSVAFSADSSRLIAAGNTSAINIYDVATCDETPMVSLTPASLDARTTVKLARYANNGSDIVVSMSSNPSEKKALSVWDVRSGGLERMIDLGATAKSGELSMDGSMLSVTCDDATVSVFDLKKMVRVRRFKVPEATESASVRFPAMDMVATGGQDLIVRRFEATSADCENLSEAEFNRGHHGPVWVLRFAPDGETYASGSDDGTIRIWKTTVDPELATSGA
jgi:serine-threonine kinase receptor-associated protein